MRSHARCQLYPALPPANAAPEYQSDTIPVVASKSIDDRYTMSRSCSFAPFTSTGDGKVSPPHAIRAHREPQSVGDAAARLFHRVDRPVFAARVNPFHINVPRESVPIRERHRLGSAPVHAVVAPAQLDRRARGVAPVRSGVDAPHHPCSLPSPHHTRRHDRVIGRGHREHGCAPDHTVRGSDQPDLVLLLHASKVDPQLVRIRIVQHIRIGVVATERCLERVLNTVGNCPARARAAGKEGWIFVRLVAAGIRRRDEAKGVAAPRRWQSHEVRMHGLSRSRRTSPAGARRRRKMAGGSRTNARRTLAPVAAVTVSECGPATVSSCQRARARPNRSVTSAAGITTVMSGLLRRPRDRNAAHRTLFRISQLDHDLRRQLRGRDCRLTIAGCDRKHREARMVQRHCCRHSRAASAATSAAERHRMFFRLNVPKRRVRQPHDDGTFKLPRLSRRRRVT